MLTEPWEQRYGSPCTYILHLFPIYTKSLLDFKETLCEKKMGDRKVRPFLPTHVVLKKRQRRVIQHLDGHNCTKDGPELELNRSTEVQWKIGMVGYARP